MDGREAKIVRHEDTKKMKEKELNTPFSEIEFDFTLTGIAKKIPKKWFIGGGWRLPKRSTHAALRTWNRARSTINPWHHKFGARRRLRFEGEVTW